MDDLLHRSELEIEGARSFLLSLFAGTDILHRDLFPPGNLGLGGGVLNSRFSSFSPETHADDRRMWRSRCLRTLDRSLSFSIKILFVLINSKIKRHFTRGRGLLKFSRDPSNLYLVGNSVCPPASRLKKVWALRVP